MVNPIEGQFNMTKSETVDNIGEVDMEQVTQIKDDIDQFISGRLLKELSQDQLNTILTRYEKMKETLGITPKNSKDQTIQTKTPEGEPIEFNLENILNESKELYNSLNLEEWAKELPEKIELTEDQKNDIKEKVEKHGFNKMRIFPSVETQNKTLGKLKEETEKPIAGLEDAEQYADEGTWLSSTVKPEFPEKIENTNRPKGCYIQLYKDDPEVSDDTLNKTYSEAREYQKENDLKGYTLPEYLIFQRAFTIENKKHPDDKKWIWITNSELDSSRVLDAGWHSGARRVDVYSNDSVHLLDNLGFRSSAVLSL